MDIGSLFVERNIFNRRNLECAIWFVCSIFNVDTLFIYYDKRHNFQKIIIDNNQVCYVGEFDYY